jgi:hypothetical protein
MSLQKAVTCLGCGWVHMEVSREYAEAEVKKFNEFFYSLSKEEQNDYYGGNASSVAHYEQCHCGNSYKNFRDSEPGDCPNGCTIGPIIRKED